MDIEVTRVVIGMDPHKRTVTIEVMTAHEEVVGGGRFTTDAYGYGQLLAYARQWPHRARRLLLAQQQSTYDKVVALARSALPGPAR